MIVSIMYFYVGGNNIIEEIYYLIINFLIHNDKISIVKNVKHDKDIQ